MNNGFVFHAVKSADVKLIADVQNSNEVIQEHSSALQQTLHTSGLNQILSHKVLQLKNKNTNIKNVSEK